LVFIENKFCGTLFHSKPLTIRQMSVRNRGTEEKLILNSKAQVRKNKWTVKRTLSQYS